MPDSSSHEVQTFEAVQEREKSYIRSKEIIDQIKKANSKSERYKSDLELQSRQEKIVSQLPENFIDLLESHLEERRVDAEKHGKLANFNSYTCILGEIFENLVEIEDDHFNLFPSSEQYLQTERDKKAAKILLDVMQNPEKYGLTQSSITNTDIVKVKLENGTYVIKKAIEAKTHLDERTFGQLGRDGFRRGFQQIIDQINNMEDPKKFGLDELATGVNVEIALDYIQQLVITRDLDIHLQISETKLSKTEQEEFVEMLTSDEEVVVGRSVFSKDELKNLTQWALGEIYLKQQKFYTNHT